MGIHAAKPFFSPSTRLSLLLIFVPPACLAACISVTCSIGHPPIPTQKEYGEAVSDGLSVSLAEGLPFVIYFLLRLVKFVLGLLMEIFLLTLTPRCPHPLPATIEHAEWLQSQGRSIPVTFKFPNILSPPELQFSQTSSLSFLAAWGSLQSHTRRSLHPSLNVIHHHNRIACQLYSNDL